MELTWIAILASLSMALAAVCIFIFAVKKDYFHNKAPGDSVVCGSINTGGVLEVRATRVGAASTLARIVRTVEQAAASRTRMERSVDRVARLFIPAVLALSVVTFAGWEYKTGQPGTALMHAIAVLVIAC